MLICFIYIILRICGSYMNIIAKLSFIVYIIVADLSLAGGLTVCSYGKYSALVSTVLWGVCVCLTNT